MSVQTPVPPRRPSLGRLVAGNVLVLLVVLALVEIAARALIWLTRGSATAGLQERTLNLEYEPFVMYGPGWDATFNAFHSDGSTPVILLVGGSTAQGFA